MSVFHAEKQSEEFGFGKKMRAKRNGLKIEKKKKYKKGEKYGRILTFSSDFLQFDIY